MYKVHVISLIFVCSITWCTGQGQITGHWKTVDDSSGEVKSIIEISEQEGRYYGRIIALFLDPKENPDPICDKCDPEDDRYRKRIKGMVILKDLRKDGPEYTGGNILDPEIGRVYRCKIWLEKGNLKIRGYWGPFFRTQTWLKAS